MRSDGMRRIMIIISFTVFLGGYYALDHYSKRNQTKLDGLSFVVPDLSAALTKEAASDSLILSWAAFAIADSLTFGHEDHSIHVKSAKKYFTEKGYEEFSQALSNARIREIIEFNHHYVGAVIQSTPVLVTKDNRDGHLTYNIEMPVVLNYTNDQDSLRANVKIFLELIRTNNPQQPYGVAIDSWEWVAF